MAALDTRRPAASGSPLIRPSGSFSHEGRRPKSRDASVSTFSPEGSRWRSRLRERALAQVAEALR